MDLNGASVIVTGSSSGLGAAAAVGLAAKGARVVINYSKSEDDARAVAGQCEQAGGEAVLCQADVADCKRLAAAAMDAFGRIDGLINNAGTTRFAQHHDLDALSAEDFHAIYAVNVVGAYQMIRAVAPQMQAQGLGAVVNVSSIAGVMGRGSSVAYAASKGALNTMTLALARALGPEIRVNAICPGLIQGRWLREGLGAETYDKLVETVEKTTPLKQAGTPEDMAEAAIWLLEGAGHITGELILVDGGLHLGAGLR